MGTPNSHARKIDVIQRDLATDPHCVLSRADAHAVGLDREIMLATYETDIAPVVDYLQYSILGQAMNSYYRNSDLWFTELHTAGLDPALQAISFNIPTLVKLGKKHLVEMPKQLILTRKRQWIVVSESSTDFRDAQYSISVFSSLTDAYDAILAGFDANRSDLLYEPTIAFEICGWLRDKLRAVIRERAKRLQSMQEAEAALERRMSRIR